MVFRSGSKRKTIRLLAIFSLLLLIIVGSVNTAFAEYVTFKKAYDRTYLLLLYWDDQANSTVALYDFDTISVDEVTLLVFSSRINRSITLTITHAEAWNFTIDEPINITKVSNYTVFLNDDFTQATIHFKSSEKKELILIEYLNVRFIFYHQTKASLLPAQRFKTQGELYQFVFQQISINIAAIYAAFWLYKKILERVLYFFKISVAYFIAAILAFILIINVAFGGIFSAAGTLFDVLIVHWYILPVMVFMLTFFITNQLFNAQTKKALFKTYDITASTEALESEMKLYELVEHEDGYIVVDNSIKSFLFRLLGKYKKIEFVGNPEWEVKVKNKKIHSEYYYYDIFEKDNTITIEKTVDPYRVIAFGIIAWFSYATNMYYLIIPAIFLFISIKLEAGVVLVTLVSTMYQKFLEVLVGLRKASSLIEGAEKLRIERDELEAQLYAKSLEMAAEKQKIRELYEAHAKGQITESELKEKITEILKEKLKELEEKKNEGEKENAEQQLTKA
ncbi:MAG: hypothetical protein ACP6IU_13110 [Candidatus Asgardarchaeia archaeon]